MISPAAAHPFAAPCIPNAGTVKDTGPAFHATIPVVDMNDFKNPFSRKAFVEKVSNALREVGFFAVLNPGIQTDVLKKGYAAAIHFFRQPAEEKRRLYRPETNGQRGYVPSETAQGAIKMDFKEFLHIGPDKNIWPEGTEEFREALEDLFVALSRHNRALEEAFSEALGRETGFFSKMTDRGDSLLRAIHYFKNPQGAPWAAEHTDIDLFTILPMATEEGLQVWHNGEWIDVKVPEDAFIVNAGDMLQNITNGYFKSARHRVVSKRDEMERFSIVLFTHPRNEESLDPLRDCIETTGGVQRYPEATAKALKARRLIELGLASPELVDYDKTSGLIDRIKALAASGQAAEPVMKTHEAYQKATQSRGENF